MHYLATDTTTMCGKQLVTAGHVTAHIDDFLEEIASNNPKVCEQCIKVMRRYSLQANALDLANKERMRRIQAGMI